MKTHVYKLVLGLFITLFAFNLNAQEYEYIPMVKPGLQIWTDDFTDAANRYYFRRFALTDEDTVIDNQTYKKLYFFTNPSFNPLTDTCIGGLREDEQRRVYYKGKNLNGCVYSRLICDFSLSIGDTYNLYYQIDFVVHSIDTLEISGIKRRAFSLKPSFDTLSENPHIACVWIEGIGNKNGLLYDVINNITHNEAGGWDRCYEHNGVLLYHNYLYGIEDCITPLYGLNEIKLEDNSITLYPNPTSMDVNISSESIINSIEVFNSLGQKVYQTNVKQKEKTLDINSLSKGVYIIGVSTDMGYIRKKLIKE